MTFLPSFSVRNPVFVNVCMVVVLVAGASSALTIVREMFPESETQFFVRTANVQVEFVKDASGTVTHLMMHEPKSISRANKIE